MMILCELAVAISPQIGQAHLINGGRRIRVFHTSRLVLVRKSDHWSLSDNCPFKEVCAVLWRFDGDICLT